MELRNVANQNTMLSEKKNTKYLKVKDLDDKNQLQKELKFKSLAWLAVGQ